MIFNDRLASSFPCTVRVAFTDSPGEISEIEGIDTKEFSSKETFLNVKFSELKMEI